MDSQYVEIPRVQFALGSYGAFDEVLKGRLHLRGREMRERGAKENLFTCSINHLLRCSGKFPISCV